MMYSLKKDVGIWKESKNPMRGNFEPSSLVLWNPQDGFLDTVMVSTSTFIEFNRKYFTPRSFFLNFLEQLNTFAWELDAWMSDETIFEHPAMVYSRMECNVSETRR